MLLRIAFDAVAAGHPRASMRRLLQLDDDLTARINELALAYDGGVHVKHRLMRYHDFFVRRIRPGEHIIDIGCGYGAVAYSVAAQTGAAVIGIDNNPAHIAQAERTFQHPNLTFVFGDALRDLPCEHVDAVLLSNVLEHIDHRIEFLRNVQQRLSPTRWLIRVPMFDRDWRVPLRRELGLPYFSDVTHFTEYTRESFEAEIAAAALHITELQINWGEIWADVRKDV